MNINPKVETIPVGLGKLKFHLLKTGKIHQITYDQKMINQLRVTDQDIMFSNIYLRMKKDDSYQWMKVIGNSVTSYDENHLIYQGRFENVTYEVKITVLNHMWFIDVTFDQNQNEIEVFYVQDIGIKHGGGIRNNEAYNSQYIDHKVFKHAQGYSICSKQNQGDDEYLQIGSLTNTIGYATDGYQFFGLDYKFNDTPVQMLQEQLPNEIYQYEFACASLQSEKILKSQKVTFYGYFNPKHIGSIKTLEFLDEVKEAYANLDQGITNDIALDKADVLCDTNILFTSEPLLRKEIDQLYQDRRFEEYHEKELLSFFGKNHEHIVLQSKERVVERMHGHIILNGDTHDIKEEKLASTSFMAGVFNSQVVLGNTSFNKFISNTGNMLNIQRTNGQRIFVKLDGQYQLLGMPAVYEMGFNYAKWIYKINDDLLEVVSFTEFSGNQLNLVIKSQLGYTYQMLITQQITMGNEELDHDFIVNKTNLGYIFHPVDHVMMKHTYPNIKFEINVLGREIEKPLKDMVEDSLFIIEIEDSQVEINMFSSLDENHVTNHINFEQEKQKFISFYSDSVNGFHLSIDKKHKKAQEVDKFNTIMYWYTHDALIHYQSPHGLEQFGGAAWGTRDVCQGPFEYFLSLGKYDEAKKILMDVYKHQFIENGDWPQWFMFDKYFHIQAKESHGDIIVWPLRSLALYLHATGDVDILDEKVSYTLLDSSEYTNEKVTLLDHVKKAVSHIIEHYIPNTHLSSYGDGDWDDTLQPANPALRKSMVSGWTTALTFETFKLLESMIQSKDLSFAKLLKEEAKLIQTDYQTYVIKDEVPAGFLHFGEEGIRYIIHPTDDVTHMKYRLLPMNRGLISEMFDKQQADHLYQVIKENLYHPDGVRLMDRTVDYHGGDNTYFKRAETSANFGREIGLQYVHAHIRFVEAMAKYGLGDEVWNGLLKINPITIKDVVKNASYRQANAYFSSSDGAFLNRYEAMKDFNKLFTGDIEVKGGWRVYSSGPGIYVHQVVGKMLGLSFDKDHMLLDPQIPSEFDGMTYELIYEGKPLKIVYHLNQKQKHMVLNGKEVEFKLEKNLYREGSVSLSKSLFNDAHENILEYFG
ncbi:MAG: cellobiose phosphorylase [Acholeplasmataceae bacterium]